MFHVSHAKQRYYELRTNSSSLASCQGSLRRSMMNATCPKISRCLVRISADLIDLSDVGLGYSEKSI